MWGEGFRALHFAVRPGVILHQLGRAAIALAVLTLLPTLAAWLDGRLDVAMRQLLLIVGLGATGLAGERMRASERIQANEALVVSALVFLLSGLVFAFPLAAYGLAPLDAVFESISGVTTTGLTTLGSIAGRPASFLFLRAWLQWVGGLGVVVLALAFVIPSGIAARRLGFDDIEAADFVGATRAHARSVLLAYLGLTAAGFLLCVGVGFDAFDALAQTLAAVSTGGFSTADASLAGRTPAARSAVLLLCLAGSVSFSFYLRRPRLRSLARDARLWSLVGLVALGSLAIGLFLEASSTGSIAMHFSQAAWLAASAQSTAGFSTLDPASLPAGAKVVLIGAMAVGGDVGSTAGGLKIVRLLILLRLVALRIVRASTARGSHWVPRIGGRRVPIEEIEAAAALATGGALVVVASWLAFLAYGHPPLDALFDVVSAVGTVGLSTGTTGPALEPLLKGVLCVDMLMGRVELFAFLVLLLPGTWIGRRRSWRSA
ncbi:MAG: potassium transporter TrkG [Myxococcota bacterium]